MLNIARYIYSLLLILVLPVIFLRLLWRSIKLPAYRVRLCERLGIYKTSSMRKDGILIHAVSVGEVVAAIPLIKALQKQYPQLPLTITTITPTGSQRVQQTFGDSVAHVYLPYDLSFAINSLLDKIAPKAVIIMETEIWPNFITSCKHLNIPVIIANGRISDSSVVGYKKIKWFIKPILKQLSCVAAQSRMDGERFLTLGLPKESLQITGNLKFDVQTNTQQQTAGLALKAQLRNRLVFVAASTHNGEENQVLAAFNQIRSQVPQALLILIPRHPDRFNTVAEILQQQQINFVRRSENRVCTDEVAVLLGDSMGEMTMYYAMADLVFMGGSLIPIGGHNLLEPAALGVPSITGPNVHNFREITQLLQNANAVWMVQNSDELAAKAIELLNNPALRQQMGAAALQTVQTNKGALNKLMQIMAHYLQDTFPSAVSAAID